MANYKKITILIIILAVAAAVLLYARDLSNGNGQNSESRIQNSEYEGWLTYRNEEYGFEMKYPKEWTIEEKEQIFLTKKENLIMFNPPNNIGHQFLFIYNINENNKARCEPNFNIRTKINAINVGGYDSYVAYSKKDTNLYISEDEIITYTYCVKAENSHIGMALTPSLIGDKDPVTKEDFYKVLDTIIFNKN